METDRKKSKPSRADSPSAARGERRRHPQPASEGPQAADADDERTASVPLEPAQRHPRHTDDTQAPDEARPRAWDDRAG